MPPPNEERPTKSLKLNEHGRSVAEDEPYALSPLRGIHSLNSLDTVRARRKRGRIVRLAYNEPKREIGLRVGQYVQPRPLSMSHFSRAPQYFSLSGE
jgi:hypothetical protein